MSNLVTFPKKAAILSDLIQTISNLPVTGSDGALINELFQQKAAILAELRLNFHGIIAEKQERGTSYNVTINCPYKGEATSSGAAEGVVLSVISGVSEEYLNKFSQAIVGRTIKQGVVEVKNLGDLSGFYALDARGKVIAKGFSVDELKENLKPIIGTGNVSEVFHAQRDEDCSRMEFDEAIEKAEKFNDQTPLHIAVQKGFVNTVGVLIGKQKENALKTGDGDGITPMHWASENSAVMGKILEMTDINIEDLLSLGAGTDVGTPMHWATKYPDVMRAILDKVTESPEGLRQLLLQADVKGVTPMHLATKNDFVMEAILDKVPVENLVDALVIKDDFNLTPIDEAASYEPPTVLEAILSKLEQLGQGLLSEELLKVLRDNQKSPMSSTEAKGKISAFLEKFDPSLTGAASKPIERQEEDVSRPSLGQVNEFYQAIKQAVTSSNKEGLRQSLTDAIHGGVNIIRLLEMDKGKEGGTLLHSAARSEDPKLIQAILERVQENDRQHVLLLKDNNGDTPMHWAAANNNSAVMAEILKTRGIIDINFLLKIGNKQHGGVTPMHWAADNAAVMTEILNTPDIDINVLLIGTEADGRGDTPLHWAACEDTPDVMRVILAKLEQVRPQRIEKLLGVLKSIQGLSETKEANKHFISAFLGKFDTSPTGAATEQGPSSD